MSNSCPRCGAPGGSSAACGSCQHHIQRSSGSNDNSNNGCFPSGTKILTPYGSAAIEELKANNIISSICLKSNRIVARKILRVACHANRPIWNLVYQGGETVRTTSVHSFRTSKGWKEASKIKTGDEIIHCQQDGVIGLKVVMDSACSVDVEDVYNLIVEKNFNFIAEGAVVHSFTYFRALRGFAWSLMTATDGAPITRLGVEPKSI